MQQHLCAKDCFVGEPNGGIGLAAVAAQTGANKPPVWRAEGKSLPAVTSELLCKSQTCTRSPGSQCLASLWTAQDLFLHSSPGPSAAPLMLGLRRSPVGLLVLLTGRCSSGATVPVQSGPTSPGKQTPRIHPAALWDVSYLLQPIPLQKAFPKQLPSQHPALPERSLHVQDPTPLLS